MSNCKTIAICNQKGGVGKTTTTVHLGIGLAMQGKKVLLVDADPQGDLTTCLGWQDTDELPITLADKLLSVIQDKRDDPASGILHHAEGVDLIPSNLELSALEMSLVTAMSREAALKDYLQQVKDSYDYCLIDCMPSLGMITLNALTAADSVIIPVQAQYCSHRAILPGFNDLETVMPEVAREWSKRNYPLLPSQVAPFANKRVWWRCEKRHEWYALISTRSGGSKCPYCTGIKLLKGFNDFATQYPLLANEWSERNMPLTPDTFSAKATSNVWWRCGVCGHEYKAVISSRVKGLKCPVCADRAIKEGVNDLATTDPEVLSEWDYEKNGKVLPTRVSRNSTSYVWWKCPLGHSRRDRIYNRTIEHKHCPTCEADFENALPQLLVSYYARKNHLKVVLNDENTIGIQISAYIPELRLAFDFPTKGTQREKSIGDVIAHLCEKRGIHYVQVAGNQKSEVICAEIRKGFGWAHIFITSDNNQDMANLHKLFFQWRGRST